MKEKNKWIYIIYLHKRKTLGTSERYMELYLVIFRRTTSDISILFYSSPLFSKLNKISARKNFVHDLFISSNTNGKWIIITFIYFYKNQMPCYFANKILLQMKKKTDGKKKREMGELNEIHYCIVND